MVSSFLLFSSSELAHHLDPIYSGIYGLLCKAFGCIQIPYGMYGMYFTPPSLLLHFCLLLSAIARPPIRDTAGIPLIPFPFWSGYQTPTVHVIEGSLPNHIR